MTDTRVVVTPTEAIDEALVAFDGDALDSTGQSPGTLFGFTSPVTGNRRQPRWPVERIRLSNPNRDLIEPRKIR